MKIDRRSFLTLAGSTGLVLGVPSWLLGAHAAEPFLGPYWVFVDAAGGWDPTMLCDPKGKATADEINPIGAGLFDELLGQ